MKKYLLAINFFFLVLNLFSADNNRLILWLMPNESPLAYTPTDPEIEEFLALHPAILNTKKELQDDKHFAAAVLGQQTILQIVDRYQTGSVTSPTVYLRILKWADAFSELCNTFVSEDAEWQPDLVQIGTTWTAYLAAKKFLIDVSRMVAEDTFFLPSLNSCRINNSEAIYAFPFLIDVRTIFYWRDYFDDPPLQLQSWSSLRSACKMLKVRNQQIIPFGFPVKRDWDLFHQFSIWLWAAGGEFINLDKPDKVSTLNSKAAGEAALFLAELSQGVSMPEFSLSELEEAFIKKKAAMLITGEWMLQRLNDRLGPGWDKQIGLALPPAGQQGVYTFIGGSNLAISKFTLIKNTYPSAIDFIRYFLKKDLLAAYAERCGILPANKEASEIFTRNWPHYGLFAEAVKHGRSYPSLPAWALIEKEMSLDSLYLFWKHIISGQPASTIKTDLKRAEQEINGILRHETPIRHSPWPFLPFLLFLLPVGFFVYNSNKQRVAYTVTIYLGHVPPRRTQQTFDICLKHYLEIYSKLERQEELFNLERFFLDYYLNAQNICLEIRYKNKALTNFAAINDARNSHQRIYLAFILYCRFCSATSEVYIGPNVGNRKMIKPTAAELILDELLTKALKKEYSVSYKKLWMSNIKELDAQLDKIFLTDDKIGYTIDPVHSRLKIKKGLIRQAIN